MLSVGGGVRSCVLVRQGTNEKAGHEELRANERAEGDHEPKRRGLVRSKGHEAVKVGRGQAS